MEKSFLCVICNCTDYKNPLKLYLANCRHCEKAGDTAGSVYEQCALRTRPRNIPGDVSAVVSQFVSLMQKTQLRKYSSVANSN